MKLKKGDIVRNRWAGAVEYRYFIFTGKSGRMTNGIEFVGGRLVKCQYYSSSLDKLFHDDKPAYEIVGHSEAFDLMKKELKEVQDNDEKRPDSRGMACFK